MSDTKLPDPLPGYVGALTVLANFWLKRIEFTDTGEKAAPELNLEECAESAFFEYLKPHGVTNAASCVDGTFEEGFTTGLRAAAILTRQPFDAEAPLRKLLDELIATIRERQKDADLEL